MKTTESLGRRHGAGYIIYLRKSEEERDRQKNSFAYQLTECRRYVDHLGLPIAQLTIPGFLEAGIIKESHSAFKTRGFELAADGSFRYDPARPKFGRLMRLLFNREFKGVISLCADRFDRNGADATLAENLLNLGVDIRYVQANYDKTGSGRLHRRIDGAFSIWYSETTSDKVRKALGELHANGVCTSTLPYGYRAVRDEHGRRVAIEIDPEVGPIIVRLFELYASGEWSFTELARWAAQQGLMTRPARPRRTPEDLAAGAENSEARISQPVNAKTIENILNNIFYVGKFIARGKALQGKHPALVSDELFNRGQGVMRVRTRSVHYIEKPFFAYRGMVRCSCGRVYTPYEQKKRSYYFCRCENSCRNLRHNVSGRQLDNVILRLLGYCSFTPAELARIEALDEAGLGPLKAEADAKVQDDRNRQRKLERDLAWLDEQKLSLLREGAYTPEDYRSEHDRLEAELAGLLDKKSAELPDIEVLRTDFLRFGDLVQNMQSAFLGATDRERHELSTQIFSELVVADEKIAQLTAKDGFGLLLARSFGQKLPVPKSSISEPFFATITVPDFAELRVAAEPENIFQRSFAAPCGEGVVVSELLSIYPYIERSIVGFESRFT